MAEMKKNDEEIDAMLDVALDKIEKLKHHAEDIGAEIANQDKHIKRVTSHVDRARDNLDKRNSDMANLL